MISMNDKKTTTNHELLLKPIAYIHTDFPTKFGIPRQSGLIPSLRATIVFEPEFRNPDALRGIEEFSHLWLIWEFSQSLRDSWSPTVRPPRLGGNERKGVFATRSPFRPNPLGLSNVKLDFVEWDTPSGAILHILGADLLDNTPIYDIKPYLPYVDSHEDATGGFAHAQMHKFLNVVIPEHLKNKLPVEEQKIITAILEQDPRPAYQKDPERVYGFPYAQMEIKFTVKDNIATVIGIEL